MKATLQEKPSLTRNYPTTDTSVAPDLPNPFEHESEYDTAIDDAENPFDPQDLEDLVLTDGSEGDSEKSPGLLRKILLSPQMGVGGGGGFGLFVYSHPSLCDWGMSGN